MKLDKDQFRIDKQNRSYYNEIAENYNHVLGENNSNRIIREKMAEKFQQIVKVGDILDFGGGTGLDLEWLTNRGYRIIFCEPSSGMRDIAVKFNQNKLQSQSIDFLDDTRVDFTQWIEKPPFARKVDAVLANFAVINNIEKLALLFQSLAQVLKPGGNFLALILHDSFKNTLRVGWLRNLILYILRRPFSFKVHHKKNWQLVFIYTLKEIKNASAGYFDFCHHEQLDQSGFSLIHLVRK